MSGTSRNLILLLALVVGLTGRLLAADVSMTISGTEQQVSGVWDAGNITIAFGDSAGHAYSETVAYGQYSSPASIASALGAMFSRDYIALGLCSHAVGGVLYFHLRGSVTFGLPSITNPSVSFTFPLSSWKVTPAITWQAPAAITYGSSLGATQLNATVSVPSSSGPPTSLAGTFVYSPASGATPTAGSQTLSTTFTPTDTTDYNTVTISVSMTVNKATPTVTWSTPSNVYDGSALSATQLNATASVSGTFAYSPASGTVMTQGSQLLSATFTPTDSTDNNVVTATVTLTVVPPTTSTAPNSGIINTVAGDGTGGYSGDGGPATSAELYAGGVAVDASGNLYVADAGNNRIRKVTASTGDIATIAGTGTAGYSGDGGSATSAELNGPEAIVLDASGNIYFSDFYNYRIRKVTVSTGIITTVAGNGSEGYSGDGGAATSAEFNGNGAGGLAVDSSGNIYIADTYNERIRKVTASTGVITTVAGNGSEGYSGDGGAATSAELFYPNGVAVDASGNLYIADTVNSRIRKVTAFTGDISTIAGGGTVLYSGYGGVAATSVEIAYPTDVALDSGGNLYIADFYDDVLMVTASTGIVTTKAGIGAAGYSGDGGPALNAQLSGSSGIALDSGGNLYIADGSNYRIRAVGNGQSSPTLTVASSSTTSAYGSWVTLTATISSGPIGNITFYDGDVAIGTGTIIETTATLATLSLTAGTHTITAGWSGNSFYNSATSGSITQTVSKATPVITWAAPANILPGAALNAAQLNAFAPPEGTFTYSPASGTVLSTGSHTLSTTFTPIDTVDYNTATATVNLTVGKLTPTLSITWSPASPTHGQSVTFTCTATYDGQAVVNGSTLQFSLGGTNTASGTTRSGIAMWTTSSLASGSNDVGCTSGDSNYNTVEAQVYPKVYTTADSGTITLTVNGTTAATTTYGEGSTPSSIAEGLAANVASGSYVTVTAVNDSIYLQSKTSGSGTDYSYSLATTSYNSTTFTYPSFLSTAVSGSLDAGANTSGSGSTVYSYMVASGSSGYDAVSNLKGYTDSVMGTWSFGYDNLNRLTTATSGTNAPAPFTSNYGCWVYDHFGNRESESMSTTACNSNPPQLSWASYTTTNTNRMDSTSLNTNQKNYYDAAGNVLNDGVNAYLYDGDGRICAVSTTVNGTTFMTGYIYDAEGTRVAKGSIQSMSCDPAISGFQTSNETDYVIGPSGEQMTEVAMDSNNTMAWAHTNVWADGAMLATYDANGLHFYHNDPLGTRRVQTDYEGVTEQTCVGLPFGDGLACTGSTQTPTEHHFTGKERDAESGLDYFGARYYASSMGRFLSPDWAAKAMPVPYAKLDDPQSLNLYAYVRNNPLSRTDIDGHSPDWWQKLMNGAAGKGFKTDAQLAPKPGEYTVTLNSRAANIPGGKVLHAMGADHEWITTSDGKAVGMGTAKNGGEIPDKGGQSSPDKVGDPTKLVDEHGDTPTSTHTYTGVDKGAMDSYLTPGKDTGAWVPTVNDCNTWAENAIGQSMPHDAYDRAPTQWFITRSSTRMEAST